MKQRRFLLIMLALVLTSLTCNLPFNTTTEPSQAEIDELNAMITADIELGGMSENDINADGVVDNVYYTFPTFELQEKVYMTKTYSMESGGEDEFHPGIIVAFNNESGVDQAFKFTLEVPKEFASDVAELSFSLEPAEIIDPDPILSFNVSLTAEQQVDAMLIAYSVTGLDDKDLPRAKQILMEKAFDEYVNYCSFTYFPKQYQKEQCYLNMAIDFKNFINKGALESYCDLAGYNNQAGCLAIINKDISKCGMVKDKYQQENCRAYFINDLCKAEKTEEDRLICIGREAVQAKSHLACVLLPDRDMKNVCLANVHNKAFYCERIEDADLKPDCLASFGETTNTQAGSGGKIIKWFTPSKAKQDCLGFTAVTGAFPLTEAHSIKSQLSCEYSNQEDDFNVGFNIKLYPSEAEAETEWKQFHRVGEIELGVMSHLCVVREETETSYLYVQKFEYSMDGKDMVDYQLDAGAMIGRGRIYYQQRDMQTPDTALWMATLAQAQQMLGE